MRNLLALVLLGAFVGLLAWGWAFRYPLKQGAHALLLGMQTQQALKAHKPEQAITLYQQYLAQYPDANALASLLQLYDTQGQHDSAEQLVITMRQKYHQHAVILLVLANYYATMASQWEPILAQEDARNLFQQCLSRVQDTQRPLSKGLKANILSSAGRFYQLASENPAEQRLPIKEWLAQWAIYYYRLSMVAEPKQPQVRFRLAMSYQHLGQHAAAAQSYCQVLAIDPAHKQAHYNLGLSLLELGAWNDGMWHLNRTVSLWQEADNVLKAQEVAQQVQQVKSQLMRDEAQPDAGLPSSISPALAAVCFPKSTKQ